MQKVGVGNIGKIFKDILENIEHFEKLFYPKIPCKNCSTCWDTFTDEIKWF